MCGQYQSWDCRKEDCWLESSQTYSPRPVQYVRVETGHPSLPNPNSLPFLIDPLQIYISEGNSGLCAELPPKYYRRTEKLHLLLAFHYLEVKMLSYGTLIYSNLARGTLVAGGKLWDGHMRSCPSLISFIAHKPHPSHPATGSFQNLKTLFPLHCHVLIYKWQAQVIRVTVTFGNFLLTSQGKAASFSLSCLTAFLSNTDEFQVQNSITASYKTQSLCF